MKLSTAGLRLIALAGLSQIGLCQIGLAQAPVVTETKWVEDWVDKGKSKTRLRKINGRWWSEDDREVTPPSKGGFFWTLDSDPGVVQFFHHRPFPLERAESLHLWMRKEEVETALGQPNRIFGRDDHGFWYYYAANGTKLTVRFMDDGVLGEATYSAAGRAEWPDASIQSELGGRSIYALLAERATRRAQETRSASTRVNRPTTARQSGPQPSALTPVIPPPPKRTVPADALAAVTPGAEKQDVLSRLGEPSFQSAITGDEGTRESLTYYAESGDAVVIRIVNGKVVAAK